MGFRTAGTAVLGAALAFGAAAAAGEEKPADPFVERSAPAELRFISFDLPRAYPGLPYYTRMAAVGGKWPYTFELVKAPAGARITRNRGEVLWPAGKEGEAAEFEVKATDSAGKSISKSWKVSVAAKGFHFVATPEKGGDNEKGDGSLAKPWASVQRALNGAKGLGTIYVREGVYKERSRAKGAAGGYDQFLLLAGMGGGEFGHEKTTRENPLHLASYPGEHAVLEPAGEGVKRGVEFLMPYAILENVEVRNCEQFAVGVNGYNVIRGCIVRGTRGQGDNCAAIHRVGEERQELVIQDCEVHEVRQPAQPTHACGILFYHVENALIEDNRIYGIDSNGINDKDGGRANTYRGNYLHGSPTSLMLMGQNHHLDCVIHDNVMSVVGTIVRTEPPRGLILGLHEHGISRNRAHHNTVLGGVNVKRAEDTTLWNNILQIENGFVASAGGASTPGFMARRNAFWSGDAKAFKWGPFWEVPAVDLQAFAKETDAKGCLFEKVNFVDAAKGDFRLKGPEALARLAGKDDYIGAHESVLAWIAGGAAMRSAANVASRLEAEAKPGDKGRPGKTGNP